MRDLVALGLWQRRGLLGRHWMGDRDRVTMALAQVGLLGFDHRPLAMLSGGLMILPAAAARFWTPSVLPMVALAAASGLLLSCHLSLPWGPAITLSAGAASLLSVDFASRGLLMPRLSRRTHRTA